MRPDRYSLNLAARVDPDDVLRHAQTHGWVLTRSTRGPFHVLSHPGSDLDQVLVPRNARADDFAVRIVEAAERLAERERRSVNAVLADLLSPAADAPRGDEKAAPLVGHVDQLGGMPDENGRVYGEVVLSLFLDDAVLRARADLGPDDYVKAIEAHRWNQLVRMSGVVRRGRKTHRVDHVTGFALVDATEK